MARESERYLNDVDDIYVADNNLTNLGAPAAGRFLFMPLNVGPGDRCLWGDGKERR